MQRNVWVKDVCHHRRQPQSEVSFLQVGGWQNGANWIAACAGRYMDGQSLISAHTSHMLSKARYYSVHL